MKTRPGVVLVLCLATIAGHAPEVLAQRTISCSDARGENVGPCRDGSGDGGGGGTSGPSFSNLFKNLGKLFGGDAQPAPSGADRAYQLSVEGQQLSQRGDLHGALAKYREALALNPSSTSLRANIAKKEAEIASQNRDFALAAMKMREALAYTEMPGWRDYLRALEDAAAMQQRLAQNAAAFKQADALFDQQRYKEAAIKYREALGFDPTDNGARRNALLADARAAEQEGDLEFALAKLRERLSFAEPPAVDEKDYVRQYEAWVAETRARKHDSGTLQAGARNALAIMKGGSETGTPSGLVAFPAGNPPRSELEGDRAIREARTAGGNAPGARAASAMEQLLGVEASGRQAASGVDEESGADTGKTGIDTTGRVGGRAPSVDMSGMSAASGPQKTESKEVAAARAQLRLRQASLDKEIKHIDAELEKPSLSNQERQVLMVEKAKLRQEQSNVRQQEAKLDLGIYDELPAIGPAAGTKDGAPSKSRTAEPPSPVVIPQEENGKRPK